MLILRVGTTSIHAVSEARLISQHRLTVERAPSGEAALDFFHLYEYDAAVIDFELPDMTGTELVRHARQAHFGIPCVILAQHATAPMRIAALDTGADDFILAPWEPAEVMARVRAVVRRSEGHSSTLLQCGQVLMNLAQHAVFVGDRKMDLSRREYTLLELLFLRRGMVLTKSAFLNHIYAGMEEAGEKTIDVIICRIRKKFEAAGVPRLIDTIWGCGHVLHDPGPSPAA